MKDHHYISDSSEVKHIMTKHFYVLNINDPLDKANMMFKEYKIRHLPILHGSEVVGMLNNTDLNRIDYNKHKKKTSNESPFSNITLEDIMRKNPTTVRENESIKSVAKKLKMEAFHAIPVMDENGIVGIITTTDVMDFFAEGVNSEFNIRKNL